MIDHRPNEAGVSRVHLVSRYMVKSDPGTGKPYSGVIEVTYVPRDFVFESSSFEEKLVATCRGSLRPDALARLVFTQVMTVIAPTDLTVSVHVETTAHGSLAVTIDSEGQ